MNEENTKTNETEENVVGYEEVEKNKKINLKSLLKKNLKWIILILIIILIVVGIAVYFNVFYRKTLNISKYVYVEYDGFNEYGTVEAYLDTEGLEDEFETSKQYEKFLEYYELIIEPDDNLTNGDTITVSITLSNDNWLDNNKLKLDSEYITFTVEGLEDATKVDVFETLEIEVTGYSPEIRVQVNNNSSDEFIKTVSYSLSESYGLSNGDLITITANYSSLDAKEQKIVVIEDEMSYTITNQGYYIETFGETTFSEAAIETLKQDLSDIVDTYVNGSYFNNVPIDYIFDEVTDTDNLAPNTPELQNLYILTKKENNNSLKYDYYNMIYGLFKVTFTDSSNGSTYDWYFGAYVTDVAVTVDGEIANYEDLSFARYDDGTVTGDGSSLDELYTGAIDSKKEYFVIETIL